MYYTKYTRQWQVQSIFSTYYNLNLKGLLQQHTGIIHSNMTAYQVNLKRHLSSYPFSLEDVSALLHVEQAQFIQGILEQNQFEINFFKAPSSTLLPWQQPNGNCAVEAFHWLTKQPKDWLAQHASTFENLFQSTYKELPHADAKDVFERILTLTATTGSGLSFSFFYNWLSTQTLPFFTELKYHLVLAKIAEKTSPNDSIPMISKWNYELGEDKYYLRIVQLYYYRKTNPRKGLEILADLDRIFTTLEKTHQLNKKDTRTLHDIAMTYITQILYNGLHAATIEVYLDYVTTCKIFKSSWCTTLVEEALNSPGLEAIANKFREITPTAETPQIVHKNSLAALESRIFKS